MRARVVVVLVALAGLVVASPAQAAEKSANCDPESSSYLQTVLDNSDPGDVITLGEGLVCNAFDLEDGAFELPSHQIVLQGNTTGDPEVLAGAGETRILEGTDIADTVIRNLTFQNGDSSDGAALFIDGKSAPTLSNLKVIGNRSSDSGAVTIVPGGGGGTVTVEDSTFGGTDKGDPNSAGRGGGLFIDTAHAIALARNHFIGNGARTQGGGAVLELGFDDSEDGAPVTVNDNEFIGNGVQDNESSGAHLGGGLAIVTDLQGFRSITQSGNLFQDNLVVPSFGLSGSRIIIRGAKSAGGGEYTEASVLSTDDRFVKNQIAFPQGDAVRAARGNFGTGSFGGGLAVSGTELSFEGRNLVAAGNHLDAGEGGGISLDRESSDNVVFDRSQIVATTLTLLDSTVVSNDAGLGTGGAIRGSFDDHLIVHNGIIFDNPSEGQEIAGFDDGGTKEILFTDYCPPEEQQPPARGGESDGNICVDPQLVDPPNGDVHQKKGISPTIEVGSNDLVPEDLAGDWDRPADARIADSGTDGARVDMGADVVPAEEPEPTVTPTPTPTATTTTPPAAAVLGAQQKSCVSRRAFRIRLRVPRSQKASSATVRVNGKRVQVVRGTRLRAPVVLRGLPKGMFAVRISIKLASGRKVSGTRRYLTCIPRREGGIPRV